jgi:pectin methylesterase-like acyl-CoA thioesterase
VKAKLPNVFAMLALLATYLTVSPATAVAAVCTVPTLAYPTIQSAVNDPTCNPINVMPGVYPENVTIPGR